MFVVFAVSSLLVESSNLVICFPMDHLSSTDDVEREKMLCLLEEWWRRR